MASTAMAGASGSEVAFAAARGRRRKAIWHRLALLVVLAALAGAIFAGLGFRNALRPPMVVRVALPLPGLPAGQRVRVLLLSDIHGGNPDMPPERLAGIVRQANELRPDLIVLAGDYHGGKVLDWPGMRLETAVGPLAGLRAPLGVYAVLGNHDTLRWTPWAFRRQGGPITLVNAHVDVGPLVVAGLESAERQPDIAATMAGIPAGRPVLLLMHEPEQLVRRQPGRPVLALAGHTHGGQILLPWIGAPGELVKGRLLCPRGLCELGGTPVYVTSGVGTSWLPMRIGVPPEMVLITLYSGRKSGTER
jgi:predicted MPP superfamily phosphohydrolase